MSPADKKLAAVFALFHIGIVLVTIAVALLGRYMILQEKEAQRERQCAKMVQRANLTGVFHPLLIRTVCNRLDSCVIASIGTPKDFEDIIQVLILQNS